MSKNKRSKNILIKPVLILLLLSVTCSLRAQNSGKITGILKDAKTLEAISYANAIIADKNTGLTVKATQTDANGAFVIDGLPNGVFKLKISFVGYQTLVKDSIVINLQNNTINLGDIKIITAKTSMLNEVTVTAKKATIQTGVDKKVFSVNQSLVSEGGSATDLLQNVPTLQIDADGNVSLRGSTDVKVLVDGKPSLIGGGNVAQILQAIPASAIDRIEIINNPSAKYDAEGQAGIVNIVLKKNITAGFNGSVALTAGTRSNYNGSTNLSYQNNKINIYGNYNYRSGYTVSNGIQKITYLNSPDPAMFSDETFPSNTLNEVHSAKAGIDYNLTDKSILSLSGNFNSHNIHRDEFLNIDDLDASGSPVQLSNSYNTIRGNDHSYNINLDFDQKFKKPKEELTFDFGYSHGIINNFQVYDASIYNINGEAVNTDPAITQNNHDGNNTNYNIQADYVLPVGKTGKIETGYRSQIFLSGGSQYVYNLDNVTANYVANYGFTNFFNSNNQVNAVYVSYQNQIKNFSYQLGLRAEDATLKETLQAYDADNNLHTTPLKIPNKGLYPSILLTQKFAGAQQLQFNYTRRVTRPTPGELNPFVDISDPVNYGTGNPALLPEDIQNLELGYNKTWAQVSLTSSLYYNHVSNVIKHVESDPIDGVITTTPQNLNGSTSTGIESIGHFGWFKVWDFTANLNIYHRQNDAAPQFGITETSGFSWNANITNNINVVKNLSVQIRTDYKANDLLVQDRNHASFGADAAAKYDFANKKASLSLNGRDIFNSRKWSFTRVSDDTILDFERRTQGARASLTFTYHFGKSTATPKTIKKNDAQREKRIDEES